MGSMAGSKPAVHGRMQAYRDSRPNRICAAQTCSPRAGTGLLLGGVNRDPGGGQLQYHFRRHQRTLLGVPLARAADLARVAYEQLIGDGGVEHGPQQAYDLAAWSFPLRSITSLSQ